MSDDLSGYFKGVAAPVTVTSYSTLVDIGNGRGIPVVTNKRFIQWRTNRVGGKVLYQIEGRNSEVDEWEPIATGMATLGSGERLPERIERRLDLGTGEGIFIGF